MKLDKTSNPIFKTDSFKQNFTLSVSETMSISGTINKTFILAALVLVSAYYSWNNPSIIYLWIGIIGGLITAIITSFKPHISPISTPIYALFEGLFLGILSSMFESIYNGIIFQAIMLTLGVLFTMLFLYKTKIIKVTEKFKAGVLAATGGIFLFYMINMIMGFFGASFYNIGNGGMFPLIITIGIVIIAALNLVLDFDFIEKSSQKQLPKYMEWYAAFGLMVTLIWLYIEILKLLSILSRRN